MARLAANVDAAGFPARLSAIRKRFSPGAKIRAFGRALAPELETAWASWESGHVPGEARLAAALSRLPGVDGLALAKWAREGQGDMPSGAGAGSAKPPTRLPDTDAQIVRAAETVALEAAESGQALSPAVLVLVRTVLDRARGSRWALDTPGAAA